MQLFDPTKLEKMLFANSPQGYGVDLTICSLLCQCKLTLLDFFFSQPTCDLIFSIYQAHHPDITARILFYYQTRMRTKLQFRI